MTVVGGSRIVIQRNQIPVGIQASAHLECKCRTLGVPRRLFVPHPLHANGPADLFGQERRLETRIVGRRAAVPLRTLHPDDADLFTWHPKKRRDAGSHSVGLHVVGIDRHLTVRRIRGGMGRTEGRVPLERDIIFDFDDLRRACQRRVGVSDDVRPLARRGRGAAHVGEEIFRCREGRCRRLLPLDLELSGGLDGLLFPLADNRDVVALAHDPDESRNASNGRLVDADHLRTGHRRLHVARVNHARKLHVHGPFQRAVHLGRNVVALWRPAHDLEVLYRFYLRLTCGRVDVVSRQRDIEPLSPDQLSVSDAPRGIRFHGDHALADGELIDRDGKPRGCHLQQNPPGLGSHAPHRPAIGLNRI